MQPANRINHICLILDASYSMSHLKATTVKVADNLVKYLAERSQVWDQETRITVYDFSDDVRCLVYDKDVLRMPSIASLYDVRGRTALIAAVCQSIDDLRETPERYGEHSFLIYVLTDGQENASYGLNRSVGDLTKRISALPDHWTLATFVPDQQGVFEAKKFGFPVENISIWDTTSKAGLEAAGQVIRDTSEGFFEARSRGVRGTKSLFTLTTVTVSQVQQELRAVPVNEYSLYPVRLDGRIDQFIIAQTGHYLKGQAFYQLMKKETIQPQKAIAIMVNNRVYVGAEARQMLGLPNYNVQVDPGVHPGYTIFVQSTSLNRKLIGGTQLLVFHQ